ncbi:UPF0175 family protein [Desulfonatronum parangueonense]
MDKILELDCPPEILLGLHLDANQFAKLVKMETALALFRDGRLSSGMAARWLKMPRVLFLLKAMEQGSISLLNDTEEDFVRETSLV